MGSEMCIRDSSAGEAQALRSALDEASSSSLVPLAENLVAQVWTDRPSRPHEPVFALSDSITGRAFTSKIQALRDEVQKKRASGFVATMLDEVAWLFNLRGSDVPFNPVFFAFAIVTLDTCTLYIHESQLTHEVRAHLVRELRLMDVERTRVERHDRKCEKHGVKWYVAATQIKKPRHLIKHRSNKATSALLLHFIAQSLYFAREGTTCDRV